MVVYKCCKQVVRFFNRVHVPHKVEVNVLGWDHLRLPSSRATALDTKIGAQGGLAQAYRGLLPRLIQGVTQANRHRRLAFA